jgi:hypothetical protein
MDTHPWWAGAISMPRATSSKTIEKEEFTLRIGATGTKAECPLVGYTVALPDMGF